MLRFNEFNINIVKSECLQNKNLPYYLFTKTFSYYILNDRNPIQGAKMILTPSSSIQIETEKHVTTIHSLQKELESAQLTSRHNVEDLAEKVNQTVGGFINKIDNKFLWEENSEETLYTSYLIANTMKPANAVNKKIWQNLAQEVQKFFHELTPFILPPLGHKGLNLFYCNCKRIENKNIQPIYFGDERMFQARYDQEGNGFLFFQVPNFPEVILCGTSQSKQETHHFEEYVAEMPKEIQQVFDVEGIDQQISSISSRSNIKDVIIPQYLHQKTILKIEYLNMLLDVLDVPIDRSIGMAKRGEWVITTNKPIKTLYHAQFSSDERKVLVIEGIRKHLELEMEYGIILIGNRSTFNDRSMSILEKKNLFVEKGNCVFSQIPKSKLQFIEGLIIDRQEKIKKALTDIYPDFIISKVFETPITDKRKGEEIARFLASCIRNNWIALTDLISLDESIIDIVHILSHNLELLMELKVLCETKNETIPCSAQGILSLASSISDSLPAERIPLTERIPLKVTFAKFTENLIEKQKSLKILIFKYFIQAFQNHKQSSFNSVVQTAVDQLIDQANLIIDENTTKFFSAFLKNLIEELHVILESKMEINLLFYQITLLRAAHLVANQGEKDKVSDALHHCLHTHMIAKEKTRLINKLRDKVITLYATE